MDENANAKTKMKMQGRHEKLFFGSLRASRAIKNQLPNKIRHFEANPAQFHKLWPHWLC